MKSFFLLPMNFATSIKPNGLNYEAIDFAGSVGDRATEPTLCWPAVDALLKAPGGLSTSPSVATVIARKHQKKQLFEAAAKSLKLAVTLTHSVISSYLFSLSSRNEIRMKLSQLISQNNWAILIVRLTSHLHILLRKTNNLLPDPNCFLAFKQLEDYRRIVVTSSSLAIQGLESLKQRYKQFFNLLSVIAFYYNY